MCRTNSNHPISVCRHTPVGIRTRLRDRFRYWFIFTDHSMRSFSYTVGMVKCAKCGELICIPDLYYSLPFNLLYMACCAILVWGEIELLIVGALQNRILLFSCVIALLLLTYLLVDRVIWFVMMHICKWRAVVINPEEHEIFIQNESKRFADDRQIKRIMCFLGTGLGCYLIGTPQKWYMSFLFGVLAGLLILLTKRIMKKRWNNK